MQPTLQNVTIQQQPQQHQQQLQHHQQQQEKRIFVARAGTERFTIITLRGDNWSDFLEDIRQSLGLPKGSHLQLTLVEMDADVSSPNQLQSNDKVLVHIL